MKSEYCCRSLTSLGKHFVLTWEPQMSRLLMRSLSPIVATSKEIELGDEVELKISFVPPFEVHELTINDSETHLVLAGTSGTVLVTLPFNLPSCNNGAVHCSSYILDKYVYNTVNLKLRHGKWVSFHCDASERFDRSVFVSLLSNSSLRVYNVIHTSTPIFEITLPEHEQSGLSGLLGDNLVAFDCFNIKGERFSIIALTQNGDVFIAENIDCEASITDKSQIVLRGPLSILPEAEDNYGDNFTSITTLSFGTFVALVLMNSSGDILHCFLLWDCESPSSLPTVQVLERIRSEGDVGDQTEVLFDFYMDVFVAPRKFHTSSMYYYWNENGVFFVDAKCFNILEMKEGTENQLRTEVSICHCLVSSNNSMHKDQYNDGVLIGVLYLEPSNMLLCTSYVLSSFSINMSRYVTKTTAMLSTLLNRGLEIATHPRGNLATYAPFLPAIQKLISESQKMPKLSLGSSPESASEVLELTKKVVNDLREKRMNVLMNVNEQLKKRVVLILERLASQKREIAELNKSIYDLVEQSRNLAHKFEDLNGNQECLEANAEVISRQIHSRCTVSSIFEEKFLEKLSKIESGLEKKRALIRSLSSTSFKLFPRQSEEEREQFESPDSHAARQLYRQSAVKNSIAQKLIAQEASLINDLIAQINSLKSCL